MRDYFITRYIYIAGLLIVFIVVVNCSCSSDKCNTVSCANSGTCSGGACTCVTGYEGPLCETMSSSNFAGSHYVWDSGTLSGPISYTVNIYQGTTVINIILDSLYNSYFTVGVSAYISGKDAFVIPLQNLMGKNISGSGIHYNSGQVIVNYEVTDNVTGILDNRIMIWN